MSQRHLVFVYGSLKKGFHNHWLLDKPDTKFIDDASSIAPNYAMVSLGSYPGLILGNQRVSGELYEVSEDTFHSLDRLEGHPYVYKREQVRFKTVGKKVIEAWVYLFKDTDDHRSKTLTNCFWSDNEGLKR